MSAEDFPSRAGESAPDLSDPRWFAVDLDVASATYAMLRIDETVLERSSFLDTRIEAPLSDAVPLPASAVVAGALPRPRPAWLWHTSFCCSTLLARALHLPPWQECLKEPLVLRRLGDARDYGTAIDDLVLPTLQLLSRPWAVDAGIVLKPTHAALNVASELMLATPDSRAVVLTSGLEDFLVSNLKKTPDSQAKIPALAGRALRAGDFHTRLPAAALQPPDLLCAAALQWAAQREIVHDLLGGAAAGRALSLDQDELLADVAGTTQRVSAWLGLPAPADALAAHAGEVARVNAKAVDVRYDAQRRAAEWRFVVGLHRRELQAAMTWAERLLLPAMRGHPGRLPTDDPLQ